MATAATQMRIRFSDALVTGAEAARNTTKRLLILTSVTLAAAGGIHFGVVGDHMSANALHGSFFLGLGIVQIVLAGLIVAKPDRRLLGMSAAMSLGVVTLWLVSRTIGVPQSGKAVVEPFALSDISAGMLEIATVFLAVALLRRSRDRGTQRRPIRIRPAFSGGLLTVLAVVVFAFSGIGFAGSEASHAAAHGQGLAGGAGHDSTSEAGHASTSEAAHTSGDPAAHEGFFSSFLKAFENDKVCGPGEPATTPDCQKFPRQIKK